MTMDSIPIGEAARLLGTRVSTLRYYEERKLVVPAERIAGTRYYGRAELRNLAFIRIGRRLGIGLDTAKAILNDPGRRWRTTVEHQVARLDETIATAQAARTFLTHALTCPAEHPPRECPYLVTMLDDLLDGDPSHPA